MQAEVDLILLSRNASPLRGDVLAGIEAQEGMRVRFHRAFGPRRVGDPNRLATITRARNAAKSIGSAPWVMLLDDDVVLGRYCLARLVEALAGRPGFAALAADCAGEMADGWHHWDYPPHVGMASILFRRDRLQAVTFRWEAGKCECRCCCDDLRRAGLGIGYLPEATASHRPASPDPSSPADSSDGHCPAPAKAPVLPARILAAFDRHHLRLFRRRFLGSLRRAGNGETVTAVVTGLYPSERGLLERTPGVEVFPVPDDGHPAQRRLHNFQTAIAGWPEETPVAYWDAGDVVFQSSLGPLWDEVRAHPDQVHASPEIVPFDVSTVARWWAETIADPAARRRACDLFMNRPVLNSGFAAGTVRAMLRYLRGADRLLHSQDLHGSTDWGDQTAMNLYCHTHPDHWRTQYGLELLPRRPRPERLPRERQGWIERLDGGPLHVIHGNGQSMRRWDLIHLTS